MTKRPAETASAAAVVGALVAHIAGVQDPDTLSYITAGVGLLPAVITTLVANEGIRGTTRTLWRGKQA